MIDSNRVKRWALADSRNKESRQRVVSEVDYDELLVAYNELKFENARLRSDAVHVANMKMHRVLERCEVILSNMALENPHTFLGLHRWPIHHEPLRNDAKGVLPVIADALGKKGLLL